MDTKNILSAREEWLENNKTKTSKGAANQEQPLLVKRAMLIARVSDEVQKKALPAQQKKLQEYGQTLDMDCTYLEFDETAFHDTRRKFHDLVLAPLNKTKDYVIVVHDKLDRASRDASSTEKAALKKLCRDGRIASLPI